MGWKILALIEQTESWLGYIETWWTTADTATKPKTQPQRKLLSAFGEMFGSAGYGSIGRLAFGRG